MNPTSTPDEFTTQEVESVDANENPLVEIIRKHHWSAFNWQYRRHPDWTDNYTLSRGKVLYNSLTQTQTIMLPLMKLIIKNALTNVDEMPQIVFENLDNDKQREIFYNEYWLKTAQDNQLEVRDTVEKKDEMLNGRIFKGLNIVDGKVKIDTISAWDMLVDRYIDPADIDTARFVSHVHLFKPLAEIEQNEEYDKAAIKRLKTFYASVQGIVKKEENMRNYIERNDRMREMGVPDIDSPVLGETYIELNDNFLMQYDKEREKEVYFYVVTADGSEILLSKPLYKVIGRTEDEFWDDHLPFTSWGEDEEATDFWSDGLGDIVRPLNKVLNSWFSQMIENRTLKNFGMKLYDATTEEGADPFIPQTYDPVPFGWYGIPGNPNEKIMDMPIGDLSNNLDDMSFIKSIAEQAAGTPSTNQGTPYERRITLGEVQLTLQQAQKSVQGMEKFYKPAYEDLGLKFVKLLEAAGHKLDAVTVFKKGYRGNMFKKEIGPDDWKSKTGYRIKVTTKKDQLDDEADAMQRMNGALALMPGNIPLLRIVQEKACQFAELNPEQTREVLDFEKQKAQMPMMPGMGMPPGQPGAVPGMPQPGLPMQPQQPMMPPGAAMPMVGPT